MVSRCPKISVIVILNVVRQRAGPLFCMPGLVCCMRVAFYLKPGRRSELESAPRPERGLYDCSWRVLL